MVENNLRSAHSIPAAASTARVLVVEDNPVVRLALSGVIRQAPHLTLAGEVWTGEAALEAIKKDEPDIVCLDLLMPGMGGLEALKQIRESHPHVRTVIVSGVGTSEIVKEALALGADGYVLKPFHAGKVLDVLQRALMSRKNSD